jgi:hypothetical protein
VESLTAIISELKLSSKKEIREIPVYIEKDVIVEVPVPIYINQKEQKANARFMPLVGSSAEENSIAVNDMTESMEIEDKSDRNESPEQNKLGILCKSIASNVSEEFSSS